MTVVDSEVLSNELFDIETIKTQVAHEFQRRILFYNSDAGLESDPSGRNFLSFESMPKVMQDIYELQPDSKVLSMMEDYCIDDGIAKVFSVVINVNGEEKVFYANGAHILNRNGLVSKALEGNESLDEAKSKNLTVIKLDLKGFRNIDIVPTERSFNNSRMDQASKYIGDPLNTTRGGETLADYVASDVAVFAQAKVDAINHVLKQNGSNGEVIWGRIGGDEFGIVFKNIHDEQLIQTIFEMIISEEDGIQSIDTYYLKEEDSTIYPGKVRVKEDYALIKVGKGDPKVASKQFEKLKENGNFFTNTEIQAELDNPNREVKLPPNLEKIYEVSKKMFSKDNPELLGSLLQDSPELVALFQEVKGMKSFQNGEKEFAEFCVDYVYDRLSHTSVSNLRIFMRKVVDATNQTDITKRSYQGTTFYAFDLQGPKGINDLVSYGVTDLAVLSATLNLIEIRDRAKASLPTNYKNNIDILIGRSGTKLLVCIGTRPSSFTPRGLRDKLITQLTDYRGAKLLESNIECSVPLAQSRMDRRVTSIEVGRILFRRLIDNANESFKQSKILSLLSLSGSSDDIIKMATIRNLLDPNYVPPNAGIKLSEYLDDKVFIPEYFRRVRVIERVTDLIRATSALIDSYSPTRFRREEAGQSSVQTRKKLERLRQNLLSLREDKMSS